MTDAQAPPPESAPAAAPAAAPASEGAAAPATAAPFDRLDAEIPAGINQFDRTYVEDLRGEAARWRTQFREAQAAQEEMANRYGIFEQYDPGDRDVWTNLATQWATEGPAAAAATMRLIAQNVLGDPNSTQQEVAEAVEVLQETAPAQGIDEAKIEEMVSERLNAHQEEQNRAQAAQAIVNQLAGVGIEKGTPEFYSVLAIAQNHPDAGLDVMKAVEMFRGVGTKAIDGYVKGVANGSTPIATVGRSATANEAPVTNLEEARTRAEAWLTERLGS